MTMERSYLVIDLEMCKVPKPRRCKEYHYSHEIIQIGAVLLDEDYTEISTFSTFVKPEYGVMDWEISSLTGITDHDVKRSPYLAEAMQMFLGWLNGRDVTVFAWSDSDYAQFQHEIHAKRIFSMEITSFLRESRWCDYQKVFGDRYKINRSVGLAEALNLTSINPEGRLHDGLFDAINTGRLIAKLEKDPEFKLPEMFEQARKERETKPLGFSLGDLFSELNLELSA